MRISRRLFTTLIVGGAIALPTLAARPTTKHTTIQMKKIHCNGCAKKIAKKLSSLDGVKAVKSDVKKNMTVVTPEGGKQLSPRALWEAVESAGFKPVKLAGPSGTYTKKPGA